MKHRKLTCFISVVAFVASLALAFPVLPVSAATIVVNSTDDTIAEDGACTLREAIINANENDQSGSSDCAAGEASVDVINVPAGEYTLSIAGNFEDFAMTGDLDIRDSVVIAGAGAKKTTINWSPAVGGAINGVFDIPRPLGGIDVTISGLTISGFTSPGPNPSPRVGTGIQNEPGATLTVMGSIISGFHTGIFSREGPLTVIGSTVDDNRGGDGGIVSRDADTTIINSMISNNDGASFGGGLELEGGTVIVTGSTISGNTGRDSGGMAIASTGPSTITRSTFSNNEGEFGGAIWVMFGDVTITKSKITGNLAREGGGIFNSATLTLINSTVSKNEGDRDAGGILNGGTLTLTGTKFRNNEPNDCVDFAGGTGCPP